MSKTRILFVDDESNLLDGLKRTLRPYRDVWDMVFVDSGEAAMAELEKEPADVIVSDMRMPGMDGATLLARIKDGYPGTVRIVLTGHTELQAELLSIVVYEHFSGGDPF